MIKYWVMGTSTEKYIKNFIELINKGAYIGKKLEFDFEDKRLIKARLNNVVIFKTTSKPTMMQNIRVWLSLDFIRVKNGGYIISNDYNDYEKLVLSTKLNLIEIDTSDKKDMSFKLSKLINVLIESKHISYSDIKGKVSQTRGQITIKKIKNEISSYEVLLSKDKHFLKRALEVVNEYKKL